MSQARNSSSSTTENFIPIKLTTEHTSCSSHAGHLAKSTHSTKSVTIDCPIYGTKTIHEPALVELVQCKGFQRLKDVYQAGISAISIIGICAVKGRRPVNRFDHSVGAMLLVRGAGGSIEEQAAALLHDVAHTSLSHVADLVFGYIVHEDDKEKYLATTEIPEILKKYFGPVTAKRILHEENYPLLERDPPVLCADRMDYGLRDAYALGHLELEEVAEIVQDFAVHDGKFVHNSVGPARKFALAYLTCDQSAWANPLHSMLYVLATDAISAALERNALSLSDMWTYGDEAFWSRFVNSSDPEIRKLASYVSPNLVVETVAPDTPLGGDIESSTGRVIEKKHRLRTLDPEVRCGDGLKRLSEIDPDYKKRRETYLESKRLPIRYRLLLVDK